jgi:hypothetical protein
MLGKEEIEKIESKIDQTVVESNKLIELTAFVLKRAY